MGGRWRGLAVAGLGAALAGSGMVAWAETDPGPPVTDDAALLPGFGQAVGQLIRVDPQASGLSFGVEIGAAKAGHQQYTSRSSSRVFDAGLIGLSLAGRGCKGDDPTWPMEAQPQAITIDSRTEGASDGQLLEEPPFARFVAADPQPASTASVSVQTLGVPGVVTVGPARAQAWSGMPEPGGREARATVDIAEVALLDGIVRLRGLHWESVHRGGVAESHSGTFTLGALEIGGVPVAVPDAGAAFDAVNGLLAPFGVRLGFPASHLSGTIQFVDPLAVVIEPSPARDALTGGLLRALHPLREAVLDALLTASCEWAPYITIADLLIGSVTGAGTFSVELGGTEATTEPIAAPPVMGAMPGVRAATAPSAAPIAAPAPAPRPPASTGPAAPPPAAPVGEELAAGPVAPIASDEGPTRDLAAAVGLATIALGIALAEADRRSMRRAQRAAAAAEEAT